MQRWQFQKLVRWLAPVLIFMTALSVLMWEQKASHMGLTFPDDDVYVHHEVARSVAESFTYGVSSNRIAAVQDTSWRIALTGVGLLTGTLNSVSGSYLLSAVCGIVAILLTLRLARLLFPFPLFITYSSILVVLAPGLVLDTMNGSSTALATALVLGATLSHVEGLADRRRCLSFSTAILLGMASWIRVEFALLWIIFWIHAAVVYMFQNDEPRLVPYAAIRGGSGSMILALILFPLFVWNVSLCGAFWPSPPEAATAMGELLQTVDPEAPPAHLSYAMSFAMLVNHGFLHIPVARFFVGLGFVVMLALCWRQNEARYCSVIPIATFVMPVLHGFAYPLLGWEGTTVVYRALAPLYMITAAYGIFRLPSAIESLKTSWKNRLQGTPFFHGWWSVTASVLFFTCLQYNARLIEQRVELLRDVTAVRGVIDKGFEQHRLTAQTVLTDQPGWFAFTHRLATLDLTGALSPALFSCVGDTAGMDAGCVKEVIRRHRPDLLVYWNPCYDHIPEVFEARGIRLPWGSRDKYLPQMYRMRWPASF